MWQYGVGHATFEMKPKIKIGQCKYLFHIMIVSTSSLMALNQSANLEFAKIA